MIEFTRKGLVLLEHSVLAEQLAACCLRGVRPPARLRRRVRRAQRQALAAPAAVGLCCDAGQCLGELALLLEDICPLPPGFVQAAAPLGLYAAAAPGELGRFLLWLCGGLMPRTPGTCLRLLAYSWGEKILIDICWQGEGTKKPPRSLYRSAKHWAGKRGGMMFFAAGAARLRAVLVLPRGQAKAVRPAQYSLWAFDRFSPPYSLLPLRLILPG